MVLLKQATFSASSWVIYAFLALTFRKSIYGQITTWLKARSNHFANLLCMKFWNQQAALGMVTLLPLATYKFNYVAIIAQTTMN